MQSRRLPTARPPGRWFSSATRVPGCGGPFTRSAEASDGAPDSLDRWSRRVVSRLAEHLGGAAHFPFGGPPWLPFIRWAQRGGPVYPSPIGPLVHPDDGLWHAYRGAIAFRERLELPPRDERGSPCESCADRPCLSSCPVGAFSAVGYDVDGCVAHIGSPAGAQCLRGGCLARHACPAGPDAAYDAPQAEVPHASVSRRQKACGDRRSSAQRRHRWEAGLTRSGPLSVHGSDEKPAMSDPGPEPDPDPILVDDWHAVVGLRIPWSTQVVPDPAARNPDRDSPDRTGPGSSRPARHRNRSPRAHPVRLRIHVARRPRQGCRSIPGERRGGSAPCERKLRRRARVGVASGRELFSIWGTSRSSTRITSESSRTPRSSPTR